MRRSLLAVPLALAACNVQTTFEGSHYTCTEPPYACPPEFACEQGYCVPLGDPDLSRPADAGPTTPPPGDPDASVDTPPPPPDAGLPDPPDAQTGTVVTLRFGDGTGADITGVTRDTFLLSSDPLTSYGGENWVSIDADPAATGLLRFDLTSVPSSAIVMSASLRLDIDDPIEDGVFELYTLKQSWSESSANYVYRDSNNLWSEPGAGASSRSPLPFTTFAPRTIDFYDLELPVGVIQTWISMPQTNNGIAWVSTSTTGRGGEFRTSEATADHRPLLTLTLLLPAP